MSLAALLWVGFQLPIGPRRAQGAESDPTPAAVQPPVGPPAAAPKPAGPTDLAPPPAPPAPRPGAPLTSEPPGDTVPGQRACPVPECYRHRSVAGPPHGFKEKIVALTFDDGPNPARTGRILKTLERYHAHATFFVLGQCAQAYPQLVRAEAAQGSVVASHSYSHPSHLRKGQLAHELGRTAQLIRQDTGRDPALFRPPYGVMTNGLASAAMASGCTAVLWSNDPKDWRKGQTAGRVAGNVLSIARPGDIILLHDGVGRATPDALVTIMASLSKRGYRFVTVPEMLAAWETYNREHPHVAKAKPAAHKPSAKTTRRKSPARTAAHKPPAKTTGRKPPAKTAARRPAPKRVARASRPRR